MNANFLAIDLGASNGRVVLGQLENKQIKLSELHRFINQPVLVQGHFHWDVLRLWSEIKTGLKQYSQNYKQPLAGISIDTWGVDFALIDASGELLGNPYFYRDKRTQGMPELISKIIAKSKIYNSTGIQDMDINSLYQIYSLVINKKPQLTIAKTLLFMPDLFIYWLSGQKYAEYTIASTSQILDANSKDWAYPILEKLAITSDILPKIIEPGTIVGNILPELAQETSLNSNTPIIAAAGHDTANAVAAIPNLSPDSIYISSGTWSLVGIETDKPITDQEMMELNFTNEGGVNNSIRLLKNVAGLWLLQESRRQWQREGKDYSWDELLKLAQQAPAFKSLLDPDQAIFSKPGNQPKRIKEYCQKTNQAIPESVGEIVRICLESLALRYRWVIESLETKLKRRFKTIHIVGGGSQNKLLNQFTANACKKAVIAGPIEATALGNIMLQAIATEYIANISEGRQIIAKSVDLEEYKVLDSFEWDKAYERFKELIAND